MTGAVIIQKPIHGFAEQINDWFLYDNGLRHERVKQSFAFLSTLSYKFR